MNKLEQAARQALEALIKANHFHDYEDEITALREALAQPQGEWVDLTDDEIVQMWNDYQGFGVWVGEYSEIAYDIIAKFKSKNTPPVVQQGEPVAWRCRYCNTDMPTEHASDCPIEICGLSNAYAEPVQPVQEPLMDYERINALREGEQNGAEDAYFFVRPENDTPTLRKMFCQGFERGFHKGLKYAAPIRTKDLTDDEMWDVFISKDWTGEPLQLMSAVITAFKEKNK